MCTGKSMVTWLWYRVSGGGGVSHTTKDRTCLYPTVTSPSTPSHRSIPTSSHVFLGTHRQCYHINEGMGWWSVHATTRRWSFQWFSSRRPINGSMHLYENFLLFVRSPPLDVRFGANEMKMRATESQQIHNLLESECSRLISQSTWNLKSHSLNSLA